MPPFGWFSTTGTYVPMGIRTPVRSSAHVYPSSYPQLSSSQDRSSQIALTRRLLGIDGWRSDLAGLALKAALARERSINRRSPRERPELE